MKNLYVLVFILFFFCPLTGVKVFAQPSLGINYQAVARDGAGAPLATQTITVDFVIHRGSAAGSSSWNESFSPITNQFGLFNLVIGSTSPVNFDTIGWDKTAYWLEVFVNTLSMGTTKFQSVPYSNHSATADSLTSPPPGSFIWKKIGGKISPNTLTDSVGIGLANPMKLLHVQSAVNDRMMILESTAGATPFSGLQLKTSNKSWEIFNSFTLANQGFGIFDVNNSAYRFAIDGASGNVGIGNTAPASLFSVGSASQFQVTGAGITMGAGGVPGTPAFSFTADPNTGIYNSAADQVSITTGGAERFRVTNTQLLSVGLGAAATPAFSFTGDPNTGIYNSGADEITIATGGFNRMRISNTQNLALNTGSAAVPPWSFGTNATSGMYSPAAGELGLSSSGAERIHLTAAGNVGIGMNAPASLLHAAGQIRAGIPSGGLGGAVAANGSLVFYNATNVNTLTINTGATSANYTLTLPLAQGGANTFLQNDGTGILSWQPFAGGITGTGTVNYIPKWTGASALSSTSLLFDNGTSVTSSGQINITNSGNYQGLSVTEFSAIGAGVNLNASDGGRSFTIYSTNTSDGVAGLLKFEDETAGATRMTINATGNVGIGTTAPGAKLDVMGQIKITDGTEGVGKVLTSDAAGLATWQPAGGSSLWTDGGTVIYPTTLSDWVGIGTAAPTVPLQVNNTSGQVGLQVDGSDPFYSSIYVNATVGGGQPNYGYLQGGTYKAGHRVSAAGDWLLDVNGLTRMTVLASGNVGIGTTAPPGAMLDLKDVSASNLSAIRILDLNNTPTASLDNNGRLYLGTGFADTYTFNDFAMMVSSIRPVTFMTGNVGLGTTTPSEKLDVQGRIFLMQGTVPGTFTDRLYNVGGNLFWNGVQLDAASSNFLGTTSATTAPSRSGEITTGLYSPASGEIAAATLGNPRMLIRNDEFIFANNLNSYDEGATTVLTLEGSENALTTFNFAGIRFSDDANNGGQTNAPVASIEAWSRKDVVASNSGALRFLTKDGISLQERMTIDYNGKVGIGTNAPSYALDIMYGGVTTQMRIGGQSNKYGTLGADPSGSDFTIFGYNNGNSTKILMENQGGSSAYISFSTNNTEHARIKGDGFVGIGTTAPGAVLHVVNPAAANSSATIDHYGQLAAINLRRANGTVGAPTAIANNEIIGGVHFSGYNGSVFATTPAQIWVRATEAWGAANNGTKMEFQTTLNGTTANTTQMMIDHNGNVGIGTGGVAPVANARLAIKDGHIQTSQTAAPGIVASANAGTGATAIFTAGINANDITGQITLTTGSGAWASGTQCTVTFNKPYTSAPLVMLTPANQVAASATNSRQWYVSSTGTTFSINFGIGAVAATTYQWNYIIIEP